LMITSGTKEKYMDNLTNALQEQEDCQVADQTCKTLTEKSSPCSCQDFQGDCYEG